MPTHDEIEQALARWRAGERQAQRRQLLPRWQQAYRRAVAVAVGHLQRSTTMAELLTAYHGREHDPAEWIWLGAICADSGLPLNAVIVRNAAYWRRAQQLVTQQHRSGTG